MANHHFEFKQFTLKQDKCAMKVGTDAVLLGSWVNAFNTNKILDIGTGTGILALMLAQKSNALIDAIEIEKKAFEQATQNAKKSNWSDRINIHHTSLQNFVKQTENKYDLLISNPPYFIDSSKSNEQSRSNARHTDELSFKDLIDGVLNLMTPNGDFYVVLPINESKVFCELAEEKNLFLYKFIKVIPRTGKPEKRLLMQFSLIKNIVESNSITIENNERHSYTEEYKKLTKDFYLAF